MSETGQRSAWDDEKLAFDAWKHCGGIGGSDKDRMIQIVTWLLGFSAAIIGFQATGDLKYRWVSAFGIILSLVAAYVALLYGAYAAWNWAIADEIARAHHWRELLPNYDPLGQLGSCRQRALVRWLARPCQGKIAPVFWTFLVIALASAAIHGLIVAGLP